MKFEWNNGKAKINVKKHGIPFDIAALVFSDENSLSTYDEEHSGDENRWITIGTTLNGDILVVVHTFRKTNKQEFIRIISARKATKNEIKQYLQFKQGY